MKYVDLRFNINRIEKENNVKITEVDLTHDDFNCIINEMNSNIIKCFVSSKKLKIIDVENKYIIIDEVTFFSNNPNSVLKNNFATFCVDKGIKVGTLFTTEEVYSEDECTIKKLLE